MLSEYPFRHHQSTVAAYDKKAVEFIFRDAASDMAIESLKQPSRGVRFHVSIPRVDRDVLGNESLVDVCWMFSPALSGCFIVVPIIAYVLLRRRAAGVEAKGCGLPSVSKTGTICGGTCSPGSIKTGQKFGTLCVMIALPRGAYRSIGTPTLAYSRSNQTCTYE